MVYILYKRRWVNEMYVLIDIKIYFLAMLCNWMCASMGKHILCYVGNKALMHTNVITPSGNLHLLYI